MTDTATVRGLTWISRAVMLPPTLILVMLSIRFFTNPAQAIAGVQLMSPEGFTDTRVIAAFTLTLLLLIATSLISSVRLWIGHLELIGFTGFALLIRAYGLAHDGTTLAMGNQRRIASAEALFLLLNAVALVLQLRQRARATEHARAQ